jgi:hypothetical protein
MENPPRPDPLHDRIAQAEKRLHAAATRMSQAQELVMVAKQRLALARLALEDETARGANDPPGGNAAERNRSEKDDSGVA